MKESIILLVEDNPDDILMTERALNKTHVNNKLVVANNGYEALDYLFGDAGHAGSLPKMILLDLNLPNMKGLDVLKSIRASKKTCLLPVIILTSSREESDVTNGYALGANSYIRKPVSFTEFTEAVHRLILYWLGINEPPPEKGI